MIYLTEIGSELQFFENEFPSQEIAIIEFSITCIIENTQKKNKYPRTGMFFFRCRICEKSFSQIGDVWVNFYQNLYGL